MSNLKLEDLGSLEIKSDRDGATLSRPDLVWAICVDSEEENSFDQDEAKRVARAIRAIPGMIEALRYYADKSNYESNYVANRDRVDPGPVVFEGGEMATAALAKLETD